MTLRDLTKCQLYNLRRRCEKERKEWKAKIRRNCAYALLEGSDEAWKVAYNKGLKAGLELSK